MVDWLTDNIDNMSAGNLRGYVKSLRWLVRTERSRFAHELARRSLSAERNREIITKASRLAERGDAAGLLALFTSDDDEGHTVTTSGGDGDYLEETTYDRNGNASVRVLG